ncbi:MAG: response regulator [Deltaproteobacteria bacterium]|nr:response regulator [Deltaproteobacteria bacterium]
MPKRILIVDDDPSIMVALQFLMEEQGYGVMTAESGEIALEMIYQYKPDIVLLDIMLPGIDGWEVCKLVRLNPECQHIKIIFLTAKSSEADIIKGLELGGDAYITKPFLNDELVAMVKEHLD